MAEPTDIPDPTWLDGLIDDAALFPPTSLALDQAVATHRAHRQAEYAGLIGGFVVADVRVPDLIDALDDQDDEHDVPLPINLLVSGGAGAIGPAVRWAGRAPVLELRAIELALRDVDDLAQNAQRVVAALDAVEEDLSEVTVYVELPRWTGSPSHGWLAALDVIASADLGAKLRTGGVTPDAYPEPAELAASIDAVLDRELPFKATGGLQRALSWTDELTGFAHYGFLNLLRATRACLDGEEAVGVLQETSIAALLAGHDAASLARARRWFTGFGVPDLLEAHDDLVELGLLAIG